MDLIMTMFKPKVSMSPEKFSGMSPSKRAHESSPTRGSSGNSNGHSSRAGNKKIKTDPEPKFTFDEVKSMIDTLLTQQTRATPVGSGLKHINFEEVAVPGHSVKACQELIEKLVRMTRRVRTLQEVLSDVKANLNRRAYTEAIQRATLGVEPPKRPPAAYLLFHRERYEKLKHEVSQVAEIAKIVSEEWKNMDDRRRLHYQKKHNDLLKKYEREIKRLGLIDQEKPKRVRSAKALYIQTNMANLPDIDEMDKDEQAQFRERFAHEYDEADKDVKKHWTKQLSIEKERYKQEQDEYIAAHPHLDHNVVERQGKAKKRSSKPPPLPKTALRIFLEKKIPEGLEGQELEDTRQKLKEKFNKMSDKKQLKYIKKAIRDKERYDSEIAEFKKNFPDKRIPTFKSNVSKDQWKIYQTIVENKPEVPAPTAYLHYCGKALSDINEDSEIPTKRMVAASAAWSSLSESEKAEVEREHLEVLKSFIEKLTAWLSGMEDEKRGQIWREEPKCRPEFWRKRIAKMEKILAKKNA